MKLSTPLIKTLFILSLFTSCGAKQTGAQSLKQHSDQHIKAQKWVDSVYNSLSENERIGQLFMVAAYSGGDNYNVDKIVSLVAKHQIGGLIFMQGTAEAQAKLTNQFQKAAQVPLLIGMDAEWGLGMRLAGIKNLPRQMMIGATHDTSLAYIVGVTIAEQCKRLGVHIDFAPDIDVNNNPKNPVINFRSFGDNKEWVARLGIAYMQGLQDNGVMACAKHFPGHGDVATDSHLDLPIIRKSRAELDSLELYPFRQLSAAGVQSMMIAHLSVPALENTPNLPTTLSHKVVTDLLRNQIGFKGLIITDALNMKGVTKYFPDGETDLRAFLAGNDVLLFSQDVPLAINKIKNAIATGKATNKDLEQRVKKILMAKYKAGLAHFTPIDANNITADINRNVNAICQKVARAAITVASDQNGIIPKLSKNKRIAYVALESTDNTFYDALIKNGFTVTKLSAVNAINDASKYDAIVVGVHNISLYPGKSTAYGIATTSQTAIKSISKLKNSVIVYFGNAYAMKYSCNAPCNIVTYEDNDYTETAVADVLAGQLAAKGVLPVSPCN